MKILLAAAALLALSACARARPPGSAPETEIAIEDASGAPLEGEVQLWAADASTQAFCSIASSGCSVAVRPGVYDLLFERRRPGALSSWPEVATSGCLQARIRVEPGQRVVCRRTRRFDCSRAALDNMDCGAAAAAARAQGESQPEGRAP